MIPLLMIAGILVAWLLAILVWAIILYRRTEARWRRDPDAYRRDLEAAQK